MNLLAISGSPSDRSRSAWLLRLAQQQLAPRATHSQLLSVRNLPPAELLAAHTQAAPLQRALQLVAQADVVLVATPIYKAAYSGLLKAFLDLLPQDALRGKLVLPLATGGSPAHLLALDYAVRPLLWALGARQLLDGVYATDAQLAPAEDGGYTASPELLQRLARALAPLLAPADPAAPGWQHAA
jgi:FMN reductase